MNYRSIHIKIKEELIDELEFYVRMKGYDSLASFMRDQLLSGYTKGYPKMIKREIKKRENKIKKLNEKYGIKDAMEHTGPLYNEIQILESHRQLSNKFIEYNMPHLVLGKMLLNRGKAQQQNQPTVQKLK